MNTKPLPPHKAKQLLETFRRSMKNLEIYELAAQSDQQRKELLKRARGWVVIGRNS
jgi:DNA mismatch repair protein MutH